MGQFSNFVLDAFIAPGVSELSSVSIPDMSAHDPQSTHWVSNFFLNSMLRAKWKPPLNAYAYNYHRRAQAAFSAHGLAREATLAFLDGGKQSPNRYATALLQWEIFLGQSWHAYKLLQKGLGLQIYEAGSGTVEERLNHLYNQMKHVESRIEAGQMPPGATVPVWLTNDGLQSIDASLTYAEAGEILTDLAKWATILSDPLEAKKHLVHAGA
jgi:hypothetical protein